MGQIRKCFKDVNQKDVLRTDQKMFQGRKLERLYGADQKLFKGRK